MESKEMLYFRLFREICSKINASFELNEILALITENATKMLNAKGCILYLLDRRDNKLKTGAYYGLSKVYMNKGPVDADKSIMTSLQGETVFISDAANDPRLQYPDEARKEGIASILSVPMAVKKMVIGVMRIYTAEPRRFEEIEWEFAAGLADMSAIAIQNAHYYRSLESNYQNLINDVHTWFDYGART
jgi:signal transduction protein with GAF and PtsI domain